jgi:hypothetical protein
MENGPATVRPGAQRSPDRAPLLVALACTLPLGLAFIVARTALNVPMYDEWIWSPLVLAQHAGTLQPRDVWVPQGAHRSVVPTLLALALARLDGWNVRIEILAGIGFAALTQLAVWRLLRQRLGSPRPAALPFLIASLLLYSGVQSENWLWGFQLSWFVVNAGVVWTIVLLEGRDRAWTRVAAAAAAAAVASFSLIFGFGAWIAGAVVLFGRRAFGPAAVWCVLGLIACGIFAAGYAPPRFENGWVGGATAPLADGPQFVLAYLGAPLGIAGTRWLSEALGAGLLVAGAKLIAASRARRDGAGPWTALLAFALTAAVFEAIGRAGNGVDAALAFRYTTPATLAWVALAGLIAEREPRGPARSTPVRLAAAAAALYVTANGAGTFEALQLAGMQRAAAQALHDLPEHDDEELAQYENDPSFLRAQAAQLQAASLGPWHDARFSRKRRSTSLARSVSPPHCAQ